MGSQFKKLVANLPFNPSSVEDVALYSNGLRGRAAARGIGLMFIGLGLMLQAAIAYLEQDNVSGSLAVVLAVGLLVMAVGAFLSLRERLMALELEILRLSYLSAGGA